MSNLAQTQAIGPPILRSHNRARFVQMAYPGKAERDARMYERRQDGLSLDAIAREFDLSRETVRLTVRQMDRIAMWREGERDALRGRIALLTRAAAVRRRAGS